MRLLYIHIFCCLLLFCLPCYGQSGGGIFGERFDAGSMRAQMLDHEKIHGELDTRVKEEGLNTALHEAVESDVKDYGDVNNALDKYTRFFDMLNLLYNSLHCAANIYTTVVVVKDRISDIKTIMTTYSEQVVAKNAVEPQDTILLAIARDAIVKLAGHSQHIYDSMYSLILYFGGKYSCNTHTLMLIVDTLDKNITGIRDAVNRAYFLMWQYITLRTGYWKSPYYVHKTVGEHARDAFERWRDASRRAGGTPSSQQTTP